MHSTPTQQTAHRSNCLNSNWPLNRWLVKTSHYEVALRFLVPATQTTPFHTTQKFLQSFSNFSVYKWKVSTQFWYNAVCCFYVLLQRPTERREISEFRINLCWLWTGSRFKWLTPKLHNSWQSRDSCSLFNIGIVFFVGFLFKVCSYTTEIHAWPPGLENQSLENCQKKEKKKRSFLHKPVTRVYSIPWFEFTPFVRLIEITAHLLFGKLRFRKKCERMLHEFLRCQSFTSVLNTKPSCNWSWNFWDNHFILRKLMLAISIPFPSGLSASENHRVSELRA